MIGRLIADVKSALVDWASLTINPSGVTQRDHCTCPFDLSPANRLPRGIKTCPVLGSLTSATTRNRAIGLDQLPGLNLDRTIEVVGNNSVFDLDRGFRANSYGEGQKSQTDNALMQVFHCFSVIKGTQSNLPTNHTAFASRV
jgi:hypothetical protein